MTWSSRQQEKRDGLMFVKIEDRHQVVSFAGKRAVMLGVSVMP
jgi:hypothetical protein